MTITTLTTATELNSGIAPNNLPFSSVGQVVARFEEFLAADFAFFRARSRPFSPP